MGVYYHVVLRNDRGEYVARIDPTGWGFGPNKAVVERFSKTKLPEIVAAVEKKLGSKLTVLWVNDADGDGWDFEPNKKVPWDGPASLYDEPALPYVGLDDDQPHHPTSILVKIE